MDSYAGNVDLPQRWAMPQQTDAANNAFSAINSLGGYNTAGQMLPNIYNTVQAGANNPYRGFAQGTANALAPHGVQAGMDAITGGKQLNAAAQPFIGGSQSLLPYATNILNTGFDPQNDLYNRTYQRVRDQARVGNAAAGVGTSPYGAGVEGNVMSNFNIDWMNNLLGRQNTAAQGASTLWNTAGNAAGVGSNMLGAGANLGAQGVGTAYNAGMMPYNTFNTAEGNNLGWYNAYGQAGQQAAQIPQIQAQDWLNYVGAGNQANQIQNQNAQLGLKQSELGWGQLKDLGSGFGKLAGMTPFGKMFGF